jgi:hypothetical protein
VTNPDVVTIRPRKVRRVSFVLAPVVVVFFAVLGAVLSGPVGDTSAVFQPSDRYAMGLLGLLVAGAILMFARPRVVADAAHIRIQNIVGGYDLPWAVVRAIRFDRGNPCLTLELADDDVVMVMAVQATDKEHAVLAARELRRLFAESGVVPAPEPRAPSAPGTTFDAPERYAAG